MLLKKEEGAANREESIKSRSLPTPELAGISMAEYRELVSDEEQNRIALQVAIKEYEQFFDNLDNIGGVLAKFDKERYEDPDVLAGLKKLPEDEDGYTGDDEIDMNDPDDDGEEFVDKTGREEWFDREKLEELVAGTKNFYGGDMSEENVHCARALVTAMFHDALETIADNEVLLEEIKEGAIEFKGEEEKRQVINDTVVGIEEQEDLVTAAIRANYYISTTLVSVD